MDHDEEPCPTSSGSRVRFSLHVPERASIMRAVSASSINAARRDGPGKKQVRICADEPPSKSTPSNQRPRLRRSGSCASTAAGLDIVGDIEKSLHEFSIYDESMKVAARFSHADVVTPLDLSFNRLIISTFSAHATCYRLVMVIVALMSSVFAPLPHTFMLGQLHEFCAALQVTYGAGVIYGLRISYCDQFHFENFHPKVTLRRACKTLSFWADVLSILFYVVACVSHDKGVRVILSCVQAMRVWRLWTVRGADHSAWEDLFHFVVFGLILVHQMACVWYWVTHDVTGSPIELRNPNFIPSMQYLFVQREVWMMFLSDTRPVYSDAEVMFSICMAPLGLTMIAVLTAKVLAVQHRSALLREHRAERLALIRQVVSTLNVPRRLQNKIVEYQVFTQCIHDRAMVNVLNENLSVPLALELKLTLFHGLIANATFFKGASPNVLKHVAMSLHDCFFQPGDFILRKGEPASEMFFIQRGLCEILPDLRTGVVCTFQEMDYFGEIALLRSSSDNYRTAWVRAATFSHLNMLAKTDFDNVMDFLPEQREHMLAQMRDYIGTNLTNTTDDDSYEDMGASCWPWSDSALPEEEACPETPPQDDVMVHEVPLMVHPPPPEATCNARDPPAPGPHSIVPVPEVKQMTLPQMEPQASSAMHLSFHEVLQSKKKVPASVVPTLPSSSSSGKTPSLRVGAGNGASSTPGSANELREMRNDMLETKTAMQAMAQEWSDMRREMLEMHAATSTVKLQFGEMRSAVLETKAATSDVASRLEVVRHAVNSLTDQVAALRHTGSELDEPNLGSALDMFERALSR